MGETSLAAENSGRAFGLRAGVSELERLIIEADYYYYVTGDLGQARRISEIGEQTYRRVPIFHYDLGVYLSGFGQHEVGLKEDLAALRLAPYSGLFRRDLTYRYLLLNRVDEAAATAQEAHAKGLDSDFRSILYGIAFYRGDSAEMARQVRDAAGREADEGLLFALRADTAAYFGHLNRPQSSQMMP
jgi:hypothetical protein